MKLAISKAQEDLLEVPVGAVIVHNNEVISSANNSNIHDIDPTAHAEILAIRNACKILSTHILNQCDIYVTLEPCAMCAQAISFSKIRRLYFGAYNKKYGAIENGARIFQFCHHVPEVYGGILEAENTKLITDFFKKLRKE
ncbi:cytidine and deoxycytidylate deaminase [Ehrlichia chaffeensis str. Heartland]|uniref:tRNA-specific adenosine deaminase n=1 Tax=Ehrlichia chaffeensis (strain ATCC CRL-10679 / Arkansas) TaxID=205920 RepID=Q2GH16_EHRCR|nr:nucleoside deaminase [Ehrlichia chaffeensis]ABD45232.1 cytidine and deoxycytidylate deaminase family protein [Ehrlichia chaffeensis str. Arkansas]AHX03548.1 cytidine and deoxycytidylate deaminase [Ehrlichia chaffeensis str. Heartland]AHX05731.1 cytidine and deoxycytidylate deaminase [Ehrlichia chaffeensis str. Jax]AHX06723.1 cytidine and deoxycytidylate deaminase [Ehrlichia chaffeensis str. Liberty]AHX07417.1 cytidine and deoxycytidylate deaminase [Ehrlichia chaffeensis str. Osceola]